jgi:hypothetical protein
MATQLRMYVINRGQLDAFVAAWRAGVYPLREQHGFRIDAAWTIPERDTFVWLLSYEGSDDWQTKEAAYYASAERAALDPDPAQWIAQSNSWFVTPVKLGT